MQVLIDNITSTAKRLVDHIIIPKLVHNVICFELSNKQLQVIGYRKHIAPTNFSWILDQAWKSKSLKVNQYNN